MELDELYVHQPRAGPVGQRGTVARVLVVAGGVSVEEAGVPAGREHHGVGVEDDELAGVRVVARSTVDAIVFGDESSHEHVLAIGDGQFPGTPDERLQERLAGVVAGEGGPPERLRAEVPLVYLPVVGPGERHPPLVEFPEEA